MTEDKKTAEEFSLEVLKELCPQTWKMPSGEPFPVDKSITRQACIRGYNEGAKDVREEYFRTSDMLDSTKYFTDSVRIKQLSTDRKLLIEGMELISMMSIAQGAPNSLIAQAAREVLKKVKGGL